MEGVLSKLDLPIFNYSVKIIPTEFTAPGGGLYEKTVRIEFFNSRGSSINILNYGYVDEEALYKMIDNRDVQLNYCYVNDFSLESYRRSRNLQKNELISFTGFSATHSFFDTLETTDFSSAQFNCEKVYFRRAIFARGFVNFHEVNFCDAAVDFTKTRFGECTIDFSFSRFGKGGLCFHSVHFGNGDIFFVNAIFNNGTADFQSSTFGDGDVDFKYAKFKDSDLLFDKAAFGTGKKDFKAVEFGNGRIDFKRVHFNNGNISFEGIEVKQGKLSFRNSSFGQSNITFDYAELGQNPVIFDYVEFTSGKVSFLNAKADSVSFKSSQLNSYFNFKFAQCNMLDLRDTIIRDVIELRNKADSSVNVKTLNILGIIRLGRLILDWHGNNVMQMIYSQTDTTMRNKADQFRLLKEEFHNSGKYHDEDKAYLEFKRCEQKAYFEKLVAQNKWNALWLYPAGFFKWLVFDKMGQYATNPLRVITSMAVVYVFFSLLYYTLPNIFNTAVNSSFHLGDAHSLAVAFYYSAVTFFTIGYGDYYPTGMLRIIAACEGCSGMFLMSYFTVAFVRKILR